MFQDKVDVPQKHADEPGCRVIYSFPLDDSEW